MYSICFSKGSINSEPLAKVTWTNLEATNGARIRPGDEEDACGNPRFLAGNRIVKVCCWQRNFKTAVKSERKFFSSGLLLCQCRQTRV